MRRFFFIVFLISSNSFAQQKFYPVVYIDTLIDFTKEDSLALNKELNILQSILRNDTFWSRIKSATFYCTNRRIYHAKRSRKSIYPRIKKDKHFYTSTEIHDLIWNGEDEIGQSKDGIINLKLMAKDYEPNKNGSITHGSTNKNTLIIKSNRATRIHSAIPGKYACHILHEYMHVLGFKHIDNSPTKNTEKCGGIDVPLRIQKIAESVLK